MLRHPHGDTFLQGAEPLLLPLTLRETLRESHRAGLPTSDPPAQTMPQPTSHVPHGRKHTALPSLGGTGSLGPIISTLSLGRNDVVDEQHNANVRAGSRTITTTSSSTTPTSAPASPATHDGRRTLAP